MSPELTERTLDRSRRGSPADLEGAGSSSFNDRAAYWIATGVFASFMAYNGVVLAAYNTRMAAAIAILGYPAYFARILGASKLVGAVIVLLPGFPRLKEWAYAGFAFTTAGAILSHLAVGQRGAAVFPLAALILMAISYLMRPPQRRILEAAAAVR
jgi:hypothetical protein